MAISDTSLMLTVSSSMAAAVAALDSAWLRVARLISLAATDRFSGFLGQNLGAGEYAAHDAGQPVLHRAQGRQQVARLVAGGDDAPRQVAAGEPFRLLRGHGGFTADLALHAAVDRPAQHAEHGCDHPKEQDRLQRRLPEFRIHILDVHARCQPPAPGLEHLGVRHLRDRILGARPWGTCSPCRRCRLFLSRSIHSLM